MTDFWEWDQITDTWTQKNNFVGLSRGYFPGYVINGKGYISTGYSNGNALNDNWEYNPVSDSWTQMANFPAAARWDASAFSICDKGYLGTGGEAPFYDDFWQFDPILNQWIQKANVPGGPRDDCAYFSIGNKGYIGLGQLFGTTFALDFWEYTPDSTCSTGIEEITNDNLEFTISSNPAKDILIISYPLTIKEKINLTLTDVSGKIIFNTRPEINHHQSLLSINNLSKGIYFIEATDGKQRVVRKFVKE